MISHGEASFRYGVAGMVTEFYDEAMKLLAKLTQTLCRVTVSRYARLICGR